MGSLYNELMEDVRLKEGVKACMDCGTCTAICPAAEFYNYSPRRVMDLVQSKDDEKIEKLLKGDTIWYCGECMSCKSRCPRGNAPGLVIMALRHLSIMKGWFTESEKGRQQLLIRRTIGNWIETTGYCVVIKGITTEMHPEQGPIWDWLQENFEDVYNRCHGNFMGEGVGALRKIPKDTIEEINRIFEITGTKKKFDWIEECSAKKAKEMGLSMEEYVEELVTKNSPHHTEGGPR